MTLFISTKMVTASDEIRDGQFGKRLEYMDGYTSWCPNHVFERDYRPSSAMSFGDALFVMEQGHKVARAGWNGKGMWIAIGAGQNDLPAGKFWNIHTHAFAEANGGTADVLPYLILKTADGKILMGWLASQTDLLAKDWVLVP